MLCLLVAGYRWCPLEQSLHIHMLQVSQKPFHEECHHSYDMHDSLSGFTFKVIWRLFDCWRLCTKLATKKLFLNWLTSFPGMIVSAWHNGHSSSGFPLDTMDTVVQCFLLTQWTHSSVPAVSSCPSPTCANILFSLDPKALLANCMPFGRHSSDRFSKNHGASSCAAVTSQIDKGALLPWNGRPSSLCCRRKSWPRITSAHSREREFYIFVFSVFVSQLYATLSRILFC